LFLLDTNVISELRKARPHGGVLAWFRGVNRHHVFLPAVALGELQAGVELTREQDPQRAEEIEAWIDSVSKSFGVLPMDDETFRIWARLLHRRSRNLAEDAMVAATAFQHGLTVATPNVRDLSLFGVPTFNPFEWSVTSAEEPDGSEPD
jgi:toxin FitB